MIPEVISEYPLFVLNGKPFKQLKRWDARISMESTWRLSEILTDGTLFVSCGLGTMEERYCLEEAIRLKKTPDRVRKELLEHIDKENTKYSGFFIDVSSIARTRRDSDLPF